IVARDVGDDHAQHVVDIAGHAVELHHLGHGADLGGEPVKPLLGMVAGLDRDENGDTEPELVLIDERDPPLNHAVGFQPLDTLPTWRRGQAHQTADLGDRVGGILLQQRENLAVDGVHRGQTPCKGNKCNLDGGGRMISSLPRVFEVYRENYSPATEIDTLMASPLQLAASKASTSARRGAAMLPPRRVHLSPVAAAANRSAATTSRPSASASANAPWNTSPAPSVSIASTAKTGLWRNVAPSRQSTSPRALGDGEKRWGRLGNGGERGAEVVEAGGGAQTLAGEHHVRGDAEQLVGHLRRPVGVEHHG